MLKTGFSGLLCLFFVSMQASPLLAESPEEKGLAIAYEANKRDDGWVDSQVNLEMVLRNARGDESRRQMRLKSLEVEGDGDKSLTIFDTPADIKGTGLLTFTHKTDADDQWLNLPALKRVKRIASKNKSGPFVGSEFAFEDLSSQEVEKYRYKYLRDETLEGQDTFVIERYPVDKYSGYTRQIVWIDKEHYRLLKVDYYDRKNSLLKTLVSADFNQYLGKYWRPGSMLMVNHQTKRSTELLWKDYEFESGLDDNDFTRNSLKRAR
jgi:Outer membrane lipoprotein-sorting protein